MLFCERNLITPLNLLDKDDYRSGALMPTLTYLMWWQALRDKTAGRCSLLERRNAYSILKMSCTRVTIHLRGKPEVITITHPALRCQKCNGCLSPT